MSLSYSNYIPPFNTSTAGLKSQPGLKFLHVTSPLHVHAKNDRNVNSNFESMHDSTGPRVHKSSPCFVLCRFTDFQVRVLQIFKSVFYRLSSPCFTDYRVRVLQIIESVFYRLSSPCFTDYRVRVLQIIESVFYRLSSPCFTDYRVRVLQIFKSVFYRFLSPVQSVFYKYSPVRVLQHRKRSKSELLFIIASLD